MMGRYSLSIMYLDITIKNMINDGTCRSCDNIFGSDTRVCIAEGTDNEAPEKVRIVMHIKIFEEGTSLSHIVDQPDKCVCLSRCIQ